MTLPCNCAAAKSLADIAAILDAMPTTGEDRALLDAAKARLGTYTAVADALGVGRSVVSQWRTKGKVPAGRRVALASLGSAP